MVGNITLSGEVGYDITLFKVVSKVQELRNQNGGTLESLNIDITSEGGNSVEGRKIYDFLKGLEFPVRTNAVEYVYSAGFTIFLAGITRSAKDDNTQFLMHSPYYADLFVILSEEDAKQVAKDIESEKRVLADLYSEILRIDKTTIINLMDNDEVILAETAKELGVISEIKAHTNYVEPYEIAAKFYTDNKHNEIIKKVKTMELKEMNEKLLAQQAEIDKLTSEKSENWVKSLFSKFKKEIKNQVEMNTEEGVMLEFEDSPAVGVRVLTELENGEGRYTLMLNDAMYTIVIVDQVISEMTEVETDGEDVEALKRRIVELEEQVAAKEDVSNKLTELENQVKEQTEFVSNLKKITAKYQKPDGEFDFTDTQERSKEPESKESKVEKMKNELKEKYNK